MTTRRNTGDGIAHDICNRSDCKFYLLTFVLVERQQRMTATLQDLNTGPAQGPITWRMRRKMFLTAVEIYQLSQLGTCGGMTRKLTELEQHVSNGGQLQTGALFVQSDRGSSDGWLNWSIDFLSCLPDDTRTRRMIVRHYAGEPDQAASRAVMQPLRNFWDAVKRQGLAGPGVAISEKFDSV